MNLSKRTVMYRCGVAAASPSAWLSASLSEVAVVAVEEAAVVAVLDVEVAVAEEEVAVAVMTMAASAAVLPKLSTLYRSPAEVWLCLLSKLVAQSKQSGDHTHTQTEREREREQEANDVSVSSASTTLMGVECQSKSLGCTYTDSNAHHTALV